MFESILTFDVICVTVVLIHPWFLMFNGWRVVLDFLVDFFELSVEFYLPN